MSIDLRVLSYLQPMIKETRLKDLTFGRIVSRSFHAIACSFQGTDRFTRFTEEGVPVKREIMKRSRPETENVGKRDILSFFQPNQSPAARCCWPAALSSAGAQISARSTISSVSGW